jgi:Homing endonuclease associated repeat
MCHNHHSHRVLDRLSDYSNESLLRELRRIASAVGSTTLTLDDIEQHGRCSYALLKQRFGGLSGALKAAGLSAKSFHRNVSDDELLGELARIWDLVLTREGRRPYKDDLVKYKSKFSQGPYYRRWGS